MYIDALLKVSAAQQVTADAVSTDCIDLGNVTPKRQVGTGEELGFGCVITAIGTTSGSTILQAISSASTNLGSATIMGSINLATADIAAGKAYFIPIPPGQPVLRYVGMQHDITGTVDYTVTAFLTTRTLFSVLELAYAKGYTA
jgi:hypothetical protein